MQRSLRATLVALTLAATFTAVVPTVAHGQATRTWVSGVGDDANPCSRTLPCKTFAGSISKTATGGEINVLDPGGFGGVTITKAITITSVGFEAGVLVSGTNAIVVNAPITAPVILRGLDIEGLGTGISGVNILGARSVTLENSSINAFTDSGVEVGNSSGNTDVFLDDVTITGMRDANNATQVPVAVNVKPTMTGTARVFARDLTVHDSEVAVEAAQGARVWLTRSALFDNLTALRTSGDGAIDVDNDSTLAGNDKDIADGAAVTVEPRVRTETTTETVTTTTPAPPPTTVTTTQTVTAPPTTAPPTTYCTVPKLTGLTLTVATTRLRRGNCTRGTVTRRASTRARRGRVLSQRRSPGSQTRKGAAVALTVGR